ncbi:YdcF family protein [Niveibacterium sp. SC-1]|uniref:YdcF family protein n=1 Tax=Niveibacterium sp. SC-1 TaxID=3135646 RepID=UPI00311E72C9
MESSTLAHARTLWNYLSSFRSEGPADAIVVCCSYDLRVCDHACELLNEGLAQRLVLSGNTGNWTRHLWTRPEAAVFAERALAKGIPEASIVLEDRATNFGENVRLARELLPDAKHVLFVTKPNSVLRVLLTARAQWPGVEANVSCPDIWFPDAVSNIVGVLGVIDEMVGDVERIREYPKRGYQAPHVLPTEVDESWGYLVQQGFTHHLMAKSR